MSHSCCSSKESRPDVNVTVSVNVDVAKIVKYSYITGIMAAGAILITKNLKKIIEILQ